MGMSHSILVSEEDIITAVFCLDHCYGFGMVAYEHCKLPSSRVWFLHLEASCRWSFWMLHIVLGMSLFAMVGIAFGSFSFVLHGVRSTNGSYMTESFTSVLAMQLAFSHCREGCQGRIWLPFCLNSLPIRPVRRLLTLEGLDSWPFSTVATTGFLLVKRLAVKVRLGFGVLLTDSFVRLNASISLEKEEFKKNWHSLSSHEGRHLQELHQLDRCSAALSRGI